MTHNTDERGILRLLNRTRQSEILFHHRYPTSTSNVRNACHPFSTKDVYKHNYVMVHNGVIWNDDTVAKAQNEEGVHYISKQPDGRFNDSEVLLYDLADVFEGRKTSLSVAGSIAFVMVQLDKKGNRKALLFGRNSGSPLKIMKYANGFSLTSEGEGVMIDTNTLFRYSYKTHKLSETHLTIPSSSYYSGKCNLYNDYDRHYEYGDYRGYDKGFNWGKKDTDHVGYNRDGERIDRNGYILPDPEKSVVFTEQVLDRYKNMAKYSADSDISIGQAVKEVKAALLYDMNYSADVAIQFAGIMLDALQPRYAELENMLQVDLDLTGAELEEYMELDVKLELLSKAMDALADKQLELALKTGMKLLTV